MNQLEQNVIKRWRSMPWRMYAKCSTCGRMTHVAGRSRGRMRCLDCFDQEDA